MEWIQLSGLKKENGDYDTYLDGAVVGYYNGSRLELAIRWKGNWILPGHYGGCTGFKESLHKAIEKYSETEILSGINVPELSLLSVMVDDAIAPKVIGFSKRQLKVLRSMDEFNSLLNYGIF